MESIKEFDRFVLLSDIHFGVRSDSIEWIENIKDYFYNFFIPKLKELSKTTKTAIIIAGDVFENRQKLDISIMSLAQTIFNDILKVNDNLKIYCITGNHDLYRRKKVENEKVITSISCINHPRFILFTEPIELELKNSNKILFIPWIGNAKQENEILKQYKDASIIIMHTDINGGTYDNGRQIVNGVNPNLTTAKQIYSGHIHKHQKNKKCTYIGTPFQIKRSDIGNEKGLYILNLTDKSFKEDFIVNDYSPKFLRVNIEDIIDLKLDEFIKIINNNYVDIIVKSKHLKYFSLSKLMDLIKDYNYKKIEVIVDKSDLEVSRIESNYDTNISIDNYIRNHIMTLEGISDIDKKQLIKINDDYIKQFSQNF